MNKHRYIMKIEYDEKAKYLIEVLRRVGKTNGFTVQPRGSGSRAPQNRADGLDLRHFDQSLPLEYAETVRIYLNYK
jgi:hypothetical protein